MLFTSLPKEVNDGKANQAAFSNSLTLFYRETAYKMKIKEVPLEVILF